MARIPSLNSLWRSWIRSESPRRSLIHWSGADKTGLIGVCFAVALISSWHFLQVPNFGPGMPAPADEVAPKNAEVIFKETQQQKLLQ